MDSHDKEPSGLRSATNPVAFGYLRADVPDENEIRVWREIAQACTAKNYRLATIYCDRGCDGSELARPGFAGLLDALALPDNAAVVVPDLTHLSTDVGVRHTLQYHVRRTGACLLAVRDTTNGPNALDQADGDVRCDQDQTGERA